MAHTFDVGVSGTVITHSERSTFLGLGELGGLEQVISTLIVDFEESHPQGILAGICFCWVEKEEKQWKQNGDERNGSCLSIMRQGC